MELSTCWGESSFRGVSSSVMRCVPFISTSPLAAGATSTTFFLMGAGGPFCTGSLPDNVLVVLVVVLLVAGLLAPRGFFVIVAVVVVVVFDVVLVSVVFVAPVLDSEVVVLL